ncbi:MAG: hypothetical protein PHR56_00520 [Dehalococcoidales bacterium]|nr:hypothetical protein [Dehalococcoidales bacterium]
MKKFLACAGTNGSETALQLMLDTAKKREPDAILFAGGIGKADANYADKMAFLTRFFIALGKSGQSTVIIPGPGDAPLWVFLRAALNAEVASPNIAVVHASLVLRDDAAFSGLGGMITENEDTGTPLIKYSHASAEYHLRNLQRAEKPEKVLLLSEPPSGNIGKTGGSSRVRELIKTSHPNVCIVAGKREFRGFEQEAHGFVVNPGALSEGSAAWIDRTAGKVEMLDLLEI